MRFPPPVPKSCGSTFKLDPRKAQLSSSTRPVVPLDFFTLTLCFHFISLMSSTHPFPCIHLPLHSTFHPKPYSYLSKPSFHFKSLVCLSSPTNASNSDREEIRWLREEQRWLREEQRWLREEQRWLRERELLLREISALKLQIQVLESRNSVEDSSLSETIEIMAGLLQVLKEKNLIAESASRVRPIDLGEKREIEEKEKKVVVEEGVRVSEKEEEGKERQPLRMGSEGEEVRAMQVCLR